MSTSTVPTDREQQLTAEEVSEQLALEGIFINLSPFTIEFGEHCTMTPEQREQLVDHMRAVWPAIVADVVRRSEHPTWCDSEGIYCMADDPRQQDRFHMSDALVLDVVVDAEGALSTIDVALEQHVDASEPSLVLGAHRLSHADAVRLTGSLVGLGLADQS